jgi:hypothetical protein
MISEEPDVDAYNSRGHTATHNQTIDVLSTSSISSAGATANHGTSTCLIPVASDLGGDRSLQ